MRLQTQATGENRLLVATRLVADEWRDVAAADEGLSLWEGYARNPRFQGARIDWADWGLNQIVAKTKRARAALSKLAGYAGAVPKDCDRSRWRRPSDATQSPSLP